MKKNKTKENQVDRSGPLLKAINACQILKSSSQQRLHPDVRIPIRAMPAKAMA